MSASRLADLRVRASAAQVVGLDVRGPVSQALGRAGITAPPADVPDETPAPDVTPTPTARRSGTKAAPSVVKPFAETPWPTRRRTPKALEPSATLSGLTADERRVHRILLDTLAIENARDGVSDELSYAEKKHLTTLDLAFIDAEVVRMTKRQTDWTNVRWIALGLGLPAALAAVVIGGEPNGLLLFALGILIGIGVLVGKGKTGGTSQRLRIYQALRELALLADPDAVTSDALAQADAVIDRLAADDDGRLRLDDMSSFRPDGTPAPTASTPVTRSRVRS